MRGHRCKGTALRGGQRQGQHPTQCSGALGTGMGGEENEVSMLGPREQLTLEMDPTGGAKSRATLGAQRAQSEPGKQAVRL